MMKKLILLLLLAFPAGVCHAEYEVRLNDGVTLIWREYTVEGNQYCTQKELGKFCIPKSDVAVLKEIRSHLSCL